jgi:chromosome partitioning protein
MTMLAVVSAKGGVGKTTLVANLASLYASSGRRVIVLDLDPQNALRLHFGMALENFDGISRATLGHQPWQSVLFDGADGVSVLPYGVVNEDDRRAFEAQLEASPLLLGQALERAGLGADLILIDTPPGPSTYTRAALLNADFALNVVLADAASYATLPQMERLIDAYASPRADFGGCAVVINQVDASRPLTKDVLRVLRSMLGERVFPGVIHQDQAVSEALACDTTVLHYNAQAQACADLRACGAWLLGAMGMAANEGHAGNTGGSGNSTWTHA